MHQHKILEDTVYFGIGSNDTSGSGDAGASPLFDVRLAGAAAGAIPVLSGSGTLLTHANFPAGCYEIAIPATAGNGFAAGNTYLVFFTILADSQNPTGFVGSFTLGPIIADLREMGGDAQSGTDLKDFADAGYDPGTNKVQGVVLVDTVTTNTDQRGTDGALTDKAGFSLSTAGILAIWHQLTAAVVTASTMGKLIKDFLNAAITSRPTAAQNRTEMDNNSTKLARLPVPIRKNTAFTNFEFEMFLASGAAATGLVGIICQRSINGAAFGSCANTATEVGSGTYKIDLEASDLNGDFITLFFSHASSDDTKIGVPTSP